MSLTIQQNKENTSNWTDQFAGVWEDIRSTEDIIEDIRSVRTENLKRFGDIENIEAENWVERE